MLWRAAYYKPIHSRRVLTSSSVCDVVLEEQTRGYEECLEDIKHLLKKAEWLKTRDGRDKTQQDLEYFKRRIDVSASFGDAGYQTTLTRCVVIAVRNADENDLKYFYTTEKEARKAAKKAAKRAAKKKTN